MRWKTAGALTVAGLIALVSWKCSPIYIIRGGIAEAKILSRRRAISDVVADPRTDSLTRRKLDLVVQARTHADKVLHLRTGASYTTYSWVDSDTLMMVLSAARKDKFEAYTWWFPIVGRVPYKGFFNFDNATREAQKLDAKGYDTYIRPTSAFSTLGWFNDPLLSTLLRYDDVDIVSTVTHELLHNTVFVPSQISFNETFAEFVGNRGAILFFCAREGLAGPKCKLAKSRWHDTLLFGAHLQSLVNGLEQVYNRADLTSAQKIAEREKVFDASRQRFIKEVIPQFQTRDYAGFERATLNNASLISRRLYYDHLDAFEAACNRMHDDLPATIAAITAAVKDHSGEPYSALAKVGA